MKCAICGKPVERVKPCPYYRRRGEVTCDDCCEECYQTEPFPCRDHDARVQMAETPLTYYVADGSVMFRGEYSAAIEKLCTLEDQRQPKERYTFRGKDGKPFARRGIEMVLSRLYDYEHQRKEGQK